MKKTVLIIIISLAFLSVLKSQTVDDALRYSQIFYSGTARFNSMGGAFTALGGDLSTLSQNPAGLGIFRSSEISITPQLYNFKADAGLFGTKMEDHQYNFSLGQGGIVVNLIRRDQEQGLITLNLGYSFNRTNNLNQSINIVGTSNNSSFLDYLAEKANGHYKDELSDKVPDAFLAWDTWLIDTLSGSGTQYGTAYSNYGDNPPSIYGQQIRHLISNTGYTGEHDIAIGGNYSNKFFFGANVGFTRLSYESRFEQRESTTEILPSKFTDFNYVFYYKNTGTGYSLKFGAIYKPNDMVRVGFSFHSPTLFRINEEVNDNMTAYFSDRATPYKSNNNTSRYGYFLTTPFRVNGGVAVQIKKLALISADYEFVDYSSAKFSAISGDNYDYTNKNDEIKNTLKTASNLRLGAELRLKSLYLRGGYGYYGKPFKSGELNSALDYNTLSLGVGFREQNIYADLGFTRLSNTRKYILYETTKGPNAETVMSDMNLKGNIIAVTFGYKFGY